MTIDPDPDAVEPAPSDAEAVLAPVAPAGGPRLVFIDQMRALAAVYVAIYHALLVLWPNAEPGHRRVMPPWYLRWADFGHVGVSVFIVLSGYSLALGPARRGRTSVGNYWNFMRKRARRLLPPYWIALAASVILLELAPKQVTTGTTGGAGDFAKGPVPFKSIAAFFFLVHDFVNVPSPNSPLWSIAVEWHLYFLFPLLVFLGCRYGMTKLVAAAVVVGVALHFALVGTDSIGTTPHFLALFSFGIASAYAVARQPFTDRRTTGGGGPAPALLGWAALAGAALSFALLSHWEVGADLVAGSLVAVALWILGSHPPTPGHPRRSVGGLLGSLGVMSYSLYLVHSPAEKVVWKFGASKLDLGPVASLGVLLATALPVAIAGAAVLYLVVERPAHRWSQALGRPPERVSAGEPPAPDAPG